MASRKPTESRLVKNEVETLKLSLTYGEKRKIALGGLPRQVNLQCWGYDAQRYYFVYPVAEALKAYLVAKATAGPVYLSSLVLDQDVVRSSVMKLFCTLVHVPAQVAGVLPAHEVRPLEKGGSPFFSVVSEELETKNMVPRSAADPLVQALFRIAFTGAGTDGTLFGAPVAKGACLRGRSSVNQEPEVTHSGRFTATLGRMPSGAPGPNGQFVRDNVRSSWAVKKPLEVCDGGGTLCGDRYYILFGLKPDVDAPGTLSKGGVTIGSLENVRLEFNIRHGRGT
ncbi:hypothetical protein BHE90_017573 [Fusarium euwallaceae]|uniref:Uncharacterized protein n=1 Tax=Fusarium euwallaceae TaxID=1147111 RepID=A0A430KX32_9HYPO|nr:hypothetical protein BHE90_017573 [Fusarium euwallaceae]